MLLAHKIALKTNNKQKTYCAKASGVARFAYNWALDEWQQQYAAYKLDASKPKPSQLSLRRQLNAIKAEQFPWMLEVSKNAPQMAIIQLGEAFKNFFNSKANYPKPRKKGVHDRFSLTNDQFKLEGSRIRIPKLGWVRMCEKLRFNGKIMSATISREANRWYISLTVDTENPILPKTKNHGVVGVDLGITALATLSTGEIIPGPKAHTAELKRLKRLSKSLSRKQKGSRNRNKAKQKLAKLHAKISHVRHDALHKLTSKLTSQAAIIAIEDLNVKGMIKNRCLSRQIADMSFFELRRQLIYKANLCGTKVVIADRFYPSSKRCSTCGYILEQLSLGIRTWTCPGCSKEHQRDLNAAYNLKQVAESSIGSCQSFQDYKKTDCSVTACGEEGSGFKHLLKTKPASMKQEVNTNSYL